MINKVITNKTLVCIRPGEFEYFQGEKPILTKGNAILKVTRIGICGTDLHAFEGTQPFFNYPRILGHELAGELIEFDDATGFERGEAVTFIPYFNCGNCFACRSGKPNCCVNIKVCGVHVNGGMAEYISVPSSSLLHGNGLNFDKLAMVEPFAIGTHGIRRANVKEGEFVLVIGAGPIGMAAMEIARIAGGKVIAMDVNNSRLQFCKERFKVYCTIDARNPEVMEQIIEITNGDMPAVVIDATGNQAAIENAFRFISHGGRYVLIGLQKNDITFSHPEFHKREATLMSSRNATREDFEYIISLMQQDKIDPLSFITHRVFFDEVKDEFGNWLNSDSGVIKAMVHVEC